MKKLTKEQLEKSEKQFDEEWSLVDHRSAIQKKMDEFEIPFEVAIKIDWTRQWKETEDQWQDRVESQISHIKLKLAKKALLDLAVSVEKLNKEFDDAFKMIGINRVTKEFREGLDKTVKDAKESVNVRQTGAGVHRVTSLRNENNEIVDIKFDDSEEKDQQKP